MTRRIVVIAVAAILALCCIVGARRWIHHAQLELVPVLVPPGASSQSVIAPSAAEVADRMVLDVRELVHHPDRPRLAVLTFDDGPYPVETPALAATLAALHAPADFFLIGEDAIRQPEIARRLLAAGIEVGNHTLTHPEMPTLPPSDQAREITGGSTAIAGVTGTAPEFFRPPHGNYDASTIDAATHEAGEYVALWDVDPGDWRTLTADEIAALTEQQARAPAVILLHDGKDATIDALPRIVDAYRKAGFTFVTLSELRARVPLEEINDPVKVTL